MEQSANTTGFEAGETSRDTVMSWDEWVSLDATSLAGLVASGAVSPRELAEQAAGAVEIVNPAINAVLELYEDTIEAPDSDGMNAEGHFHGVPMLNKDVGSQLKGRLQENGHVPLKGNRGVRDDTLTRNYRRAGFNFIGRTAVPEMSWNLLTQSRLHGETQNPWAKGYSPGGSSGGASACVSAGVLPLLWASDGAGSTRVPASYTGLLGIKHTRGLVQLWHGVNEFSFPTASEGLLARSARDYAGALDYLIAKDPGGSLFPAKEPEGSFLTALDQPLPRLRIGVSTGPWWREAPVDPEVRDAVLAMAQQLESLGHTVMPVSDEELFGKERTDINLLNTAFQNSAFKMRPVGTPPEAMLEDGLTENIIAAVMYAHSVYDWERFKFWTGGLSVFMRAFAANFQNFDLLLCPISHVPPPRNDGTLSFYAEYEGAADWQERGRIWSGHLADHARYAFAGNILGIPGMSVPGGLSKQGLPIGVQVYANWLQDGLLLQLARELEEVRGGPCAHAPFNVATADLPS
ncbi:MAG: amidase [Hyphomonadaceae bacterium]|nr:amidase [Hyphomonadaceae bacterium]